MRIDPSRIELMDNSADVIVQLEADVRALKVTPFANYIMPSSHILTMDVLEDRTLIARRPKGRVDMD